MNIVDDALDFVKFLFFLGIALIISIKIVTPILYDDTMDKSALEDKTSPVVKGLDTNSTFNGTLAPLEVVLMTQVQDYDMPNPKKFKVIAPDTPNKSVTVDIGEIGGSYRSSVNLNFYGTAVYDLIQAGTNVTSKYVLKYSDNDTPDSSDDFYSLQPK